MAESNWQVAIINPKNDKVYKKNVRDKENRYVLLGNDEPLDAEPCTIYMQPQEDSLIPIKIAKRQQLNKLVFGPNFQFNQTKTYMWRLQNSYIVPSSDLIKDVPDIGVATEWFLINRFWELLQNKQYKKIPLYMIVGDLTTTGFPVKQRMQNVTMYDTCRSMKDVASLLCLNGYLRFIQEV